MKKIVKIEELLERIESGKESIKDGELLLASICRLGTTGRGGQMARRKKHAKAIMRSFHMKTELAQEFVLAFFELYTNRGENGILKVCQDVMDSNLIPIIKGTPEEGHWYTPNAGDGIRHIEPAEPVWVDTVYYEDDKHDDEGNNIAAGRVRQFDFEHEKKLGYDAPWGRAEQGKRRYTIAETEGEWDNIQIDSFNPNKTLDSLLRKYVDEVYSGRQGGRQALRLKEKIKLFNKDDASDILYRMNLPETNIKIKSSGAHVYKYVFDKKTYDIQKRYPWHWNPDCKWEVKRPEVWTRREPAPVKREVVSIEKDERLAHYNKYELNVVGNASSMTDTRETSWVRVPTQNVDASILPYVYEESVQVIGGRIPGSGTIDGAPMETVPISNVLRSVGVFTVLKPDSSRGRVRGLDWDMSSSTRSMAREMIKEDVPWEVVRENIVARQGVNTQIGAELQISAQVNGEWRLDRFICEPCPEISGRPYVLAFETDEDRAREDVKILDKNGYCVKEKYIITRYTNKLAAWIRDGKPTPDGQAMVTSPVSDERLVKLRLIGSCTGGPGLQRGI